MKKGIIGKFSLLVFFSSVLFILVAFKCTKDIVNKSLQENDAQFPSSPFLPTPIEYPPLDILPEYPPSTLHDDEHQHDDPRPVPPTTDFAVRVQEGVNPASLAAELGLKYAGQVGTLEDYHLLRVDQEDPSFSLSSYSSSDIAAKIEAHPQVVWSEAQTFRWRAKRGITPQDPKFKDQWHLQNVGQHGTVGEDMNVVPAWNIATGRGVCVGIVDDGILYKHADLSGRYSFNNSYNFNNENHDCKPLAPDNHGTMCAGASSATTNKVCGVGVAPESSVSALRILGGPSNDAMEARALTYMYQSNHIYSNSWGPTDNGMTLEGPGPLTKAAMADGILKGRGGKGSIYVWAAGNGARYGDNCNYDGYASSRFVLTVGAVNVFGSHAYYSESCAGIIISAPSSGQDLAGITTTDYQGGCTNEFTGTSASAPLVAGVVALMLEANGNLTYRDVHHIMAETARKNDPHDVDWVENQAGFHVNHKFGFGVVDTYAAVLAAKTWENVGPEVSYVSDVVVVDQAIRDANSMEPVESYIIVDRDITLEHVEIVFTATHPVRSDLKVVLRSPHGTPSTLSSVHGSASLYELSINSPKELAKNYHVLPWPHVGPSTIEWHDQSVTSDLVITEPSNACLPLTNAGKVKGKIGIVDRGGCNITTKAKNLQNAGASVILVLNDRPGNNIEKDIRDSSIYIPTLLLFSFVDSKNISDHARKESVNACVSGKITKPNNMAPFKEWTFSTVHHWGESSVGEWKLEVFDLAKGGTGKFTEWQLKLYGTGGGIAPFHHEKLIHSTKFFLYVVIGIGFVGCLAFWSIVKYLCWNGRRKNDVQKGEGGQQQQEEALLEVTTTAELVEVPRPTVADSA